jgi:hypothetical protein
MVNYALKNKTRLSKRNYFRKADPRANYWFDFSKGKLEEYKAQFGNNFNLILAGAEDDRSDFFVIPFSAVSHLFSPSTIQDTRDRWVGSIDGTKLRMRHSDERVDVTRYHGDFTRIEKE